MKFKTLKNKKLLFVLGASAIVTVAAVVPTVVLTTQKTSSSTSTLASKNEDLVATQVLSSNEVKTVENKSFIVELMFGIAAAASMLWALID